MVRSVGGGFWPFEYPESPWKHHSCGVFHSSPSAWLQRSRSVQPTGDVTWLWEVFIWSLEHQQHSWPSQLLWFFGSLWHLNRPPHWLERQFSRALALKLWFQSCWWFKVWPWASRLGSIWCRVHLLALVVTNKTIINLDCEHSFKFNTGFLATAFLFFMAFSLFLKEYEAIYLAKLTIKMMSPMQLGRSFSLQAGVAGLCRSPLISFDLL